MHGWSLFFIITFYKQNKIIHKVDALSDKTRNLPEIPTAGVTDVLLINLKFPFFEKNTHLFTPFLGQSKLNIQNIFLHRYTITKSNPIFYKRYSYHLKERDFYFVQSFPKYFIFLNILRKKIYFL